MFVVFPKHHRSLYVFLLSLFAAATQQDDDLNSVLRQIDAPAGAEVDLVFSDAAKPFDVGQIALLHAQLGCRNLGGCISRQAIEPVRVRTGAVFQ